MTIVGGGSYQWTPELLADLLGTESLHGAHIVLEDIDPAPLVKMEALAGQARPRRSAREPRSPPRPTSAGPSTVPTS